MQKYGEKIFSNQQSGMRIYIKLVLIMHIATFINTFGLLPTKKKSTTRLITSW
jgi:hypothetical protein